MLAAGAKCRKPLIQCLCSLPAHLRVTEQIVKAASIDAAHSKADFSDLLVYSVARSHDPVGGIGTVAVMIAEEPGEVSIRLQNPYSVPLQVDSIQLL